MRHLRYLLLTVLVVAADLVTKSLAFRHLEDRGLVDGQVDWVFGDWFGWALVRNRGVTGGMGSGLNPWVITALTAVAVVGILVYLLRARNLRFLLGNGLALILGGAAGNLYDRIRFEYVRDFVDVWPRLLGSSWLHHWPTFNVADAAISIGVILLLLHALFTGRRDDRKATSEAG